MKRGATHSAETRARIAAKLRGRSAQISENTKARMADPAVRQRIRDGMAAAKNELTSLLVLRAAWAASPPGVRKRFVDEILQPICFMPATNEASAEK